MALERSTEGSEDPKTGIFSDGSQFYSPSPGRELGHDDINLVDQVLVAVNENDTYTLTQKIGIERVIVVLGELLHSITEGRLVVVENRNPLQRHLTKLQDLIKNYSKEQSQSKRQDLNVKWGYHQLSFLEEAGFDWVEIKRVYRQSSRALAQYTDELNKAAAMLNKPPIFDASVSSNP